MLTEAGKMLAKSDISDKGVFVARFQELHREESGCDSPPESLDQVRTGHLSTFVFEPHFTSMMGAYAKTVNISG